MKIPQTVINICKNMGKAPAARKCFNCPNVKALYTLDRDIAVFQHKAPNLTTVNLEMYNYTVLAKNTGKVKIDLSKPAEIILEKTQREHFLGPKELKVFYDPNCKGTIYVRKLNQKTGKIVKKPIEVNIMRSFDGEWQTTYHIMKKNLSKELGYVTIGDYAMQAKAIGYKKAPKGITISFLQNWDDKKYSGIGELADQISVEYCLKHNIKPRITSEADTGSHIAHYKRGKRFFPLEKDSIAHEYFKINYNCTDVNKVIKRLLEKSDDKKIDINKWGFAQMYMPKSLIEKYIQMIKENPILK